MVVPGRDWFWVSDVGVEGDSIHGVARNGGAEHSSSPRWRDDWAVSADAQGELTRPNDKSCAEYNSLTVDGGDQDGAHRWCDSQLTRSNVDTLAGGLHLHLISRHSGRWRGFCLDRSGYPHATSRRGRTPHYANTLFNKAFGPSRSARSGVKGPSKSPSWPRYSSLAPREGQDAFQRTPPARVGALSDSRDRRAGLSQQMFRRSTWQYLLRRVWRRHSPHRNTTDCLALALEHVLTRECLPRYVVIVGDRL
jgi:hypothetical protein